MSWWIIGAITVIVIVLAYFNRDSLNKEYEYVDEYRIIKGSEEQVQVELNNYYKKYNLEVINMRVSDGVYVLVKVEQK